jgi:3-oxoacyl-[acyl-carrier protein] reductase
MKKNIVITGGSRGIGLSTANKFKLAGHRVWILSRSNPNLEGVNWLSCDLSDCDSVQLAVSKLQEELSSVDILINNSGYLVNAPFEEVSKAELEYSYRVNVFGPFWLIQAMLPLLRGAHVLGISSIGGISGTAKFAGLSAYSSSKGALIPLFELLQEELGSKHELSFNILALGAVQTEMLSAAFPGYQAPLTSDEMGEYVCWFAENGHKYFKGKVLPVSVSTP